MDNSKPKDEIGEAKRKARNDIINSFEIGVGEERTERYVERRGRPPKKNGPNDLFNFNFKMRRELANQFREICHNNGLSSHGVLRDLVISFIVANSDHELTDIVNSERQAYLDEKEKAAKLVKDSRKSITPEKIAMKIMKTNPLDIGKKARALLDDNPFSNVDLFEEIANEIKRKEGE